MDKRKLILLGILTLFMAPIGWAIAFFPDLSVFLELNKDHTIPIILGFILGVGSACFIHLYATIDENAPHISDQLELVSSLKLNIFECVFLAFCAGFGEEMLFRGGIQHWLGPIITSVLFVAIHGYLDPRKWHVMKYGTMVLIFILAISLLKDKLGIWFCVSAHFFYDFVLFYLWKDQNSAISILKRFVILVKTQVGKTVN